MSGAPRPAVRVEVPATTANLGPVFDGAGMALDLWNRFEIRLLEPGEEPFLELSGPGVAGVEEGPAGRGRDLVHRAAAEVCRRAGLPAPVLAVRARCLVPLARGLGSSATAVVAGAVAANALHGAGLDEEALLDACTAVEGHPDNVFPALLGGLVVAARGDGGWAWVRLDPPDLRAVVAVPEPTLSTEAARAALPGRVPFADAVFNAGRAALLVAALAAGCYERLGEAMDDRLHQPYRAALVPGLGACLAAARRAGALGACLSGAGPSVLALAAADRAGAVGEAMAEAFRRGGTACRILDLVASPEGARLELL